MIREIAWWRTDQVNWYYACGACSGFPLESCTRFPWAHLMAKLVWDSTWKRLARLTNGNKSFRADGSLARCRFHVQEIPNKSKQTRVQQERGSDLATYDFERDEVLFIGALTAAHGVARAESRVFPYNRGARIRVNYLDKSTMPSVRRITVPRIAERTTVSWTKKCLTFCKPVWSMTKLLGYDIFLPSFDNEEAKKSYMSTFFFLFFFFLKNNRRQSGRCMTYWS